uniref:Uncharacterized protein n=1 Tax=Octopus bimaculoides TaxID=37653 RepID=A0A0L8I7F7_OCTBM
MFVLELMYFINSVFVVSIAVSIVFGIIGVYRVRVRSIFGRCESPCFVVVCSSFFAPLPLPFWANFHSSLLNSSSDEISEKSEVGRGMLYGSVFACVSGCVVVGC